MTSDDGRRGLQALSAAAAVATASLDARDIEQSGPTALVRCFEAHRADLWLMQGGRLVLASWASTADDAPPPNALPIFTRATLDRTTFTLNPERVADQEDEDGSWQLLVAELGATHLGIHPLTCNGRALGCLTVAHSDASDTWLQEIDIYAEQLAAAFDKARLHEQATLSERVTKLQNELLTELADCRDIASVASVVHRHALEAAASARTTLIVCDADERLLIFEPADYAPGTRPSPRLASGREHLTMSELGETAETMAPESWPVAEGEERVGIALVAMGEPIGAIVVETADVDDACSVENFLSQVAAIVSIGLENASMLERANLRSERLAAAGDITRELASLTSTNRLCSRLAETVCRRLGYTRVAVYSPDQRPLVERGEDNDGSDTEQQLVASAIGRRRLARFEAQHRTSWAVPVTNRGTVHAVLYAQHTESATTALYEDDQALLERVAEHAASALSVIRALEDLENSYVTTVQALISALEATDQYTHDHAQDVAMWAIEVGHQLGLSERDLKDLELGAIFHDIGKIAIPTEILNKPGRLTDEEFEIMKTHTVIGERIIAPIEFLKRVRPMVRHEHERWDGHGYPDGIGGDDIPLGSRIIFVCDAYHAITSDRPYRKAQSHETARRILIENAGSQFDPMVVQVFLDVVERYRAEHQSSTIDDTAAAA